jgi:hypothetical protein
MPTLAWACLPGAEAAAFAATPADAACCFPLDIGWSWRYFLPVAPLYFLRIRETAMIVRGLILLLAAALLAGCQTEKFRSRALGDVTFDQAFTAGQDVFRDYYEIDTSDRDNGRIASYPKAAHTQARRLLTSGPARQMAVLRIRKAEGMAWADVRVDVQQMESQAHQLSAITVDREIPNQTPAQEDAALTVEQRESWVTVGHDYEIERAILNDIYAQLHPTTDPATQPAE